MKLSYQDIVETPIRGEIFSIERLEEYGAYLAAELKITDNPKLIKHLLPRMRDNGQKLLSSYRTLTEAIHKKETISPAAEWLVDNFHIIEDQLREIRQDLPPSYYKELPKLALGDLAGFPRIYAIALALLAHSDSRLETETIRRFVHAFQKISPLNMGELWAIAITLRLVLVENLRRLSLRIVWDREKRILANNLADQLIENVGKEAAFQDLVSKIPTFCTQDVQVECAFIAQLAKRLRDQESEVWPACECLDTHLLQKNSSTEQVVHFEHQLQASNQVTVANIITSMRLLSSLNWQEFFESVSLVDRILEKDPAKTYKQMDFVTRDHYRHVVERIAKRTRVSELTVAQKVIDLAKSSEPSTDLRRTHVGYYLISRGASETEKCFHYRNTLKAKFFYFTFSNRNFFYFGLLGFLIALIYFVPLHFAANRGASITFLLGIGLLILIPGSDLALNILNLILTNLIRPRRLPKLDLSLGIPHQARTIVVIPSMLSDEKAIQGLIEKLEIHYLGNKDPELFFALLSDFNDGTHETLTEDDLLIQKAMEGIQRLNQQYADQKENRFFLFHRRRQWNSGEKIWMGWERKRGKLQEFNHLLRGAENTSYVAITASLPFLNTIRYVITLDADTQLPRDSAKKLIGTITHPLNRAHFDKNVGRVTEGYGVLQPRISISLESSSRSLFAQIFSGYTGIDPYTTAVSDTYQDLFNEGSFTGKGLYDVDAFGASLEGRAPENSILSHDLFEGLFARTALVSDIELLDDYPKSYDAFYQRQHRWTRGDWQIGRWILPFVPNDKGELVRNELPLISRWKILDNLRRSLVAPATLLLFISAWTFLPKPVSFWAGFALFVIAFPCLAHLANNILISPRGIPWTSHFWSTWGRTKTNLGQAALSLIFLAHQSLIQVDAIARVFYRKLVSKTKLMEWIAAAQVETQGKTSGRKPFWQTILPTESFIVCLSILLALTDRDSLKNAGPFLFIWMCYPLVALFVGLGWEKRKRALSRDGHQLMRLIARRTWHFFEAFVTSDDNWLPPDNFQQDPKDVIAHRTSPTNMGLYILSLVAAHDFGYISTRTFVVRLRLTINTMLKMERFQGHYFNWYNTQTTEPLQPKYISAVDSGNLAGYLLAVKQACLSVPHTPLAENKLIDGLRDIILIIEAEIVGFKSYKIFAEKISDCLQILSTPTPIVLSDWILFLQSLLNSLKEAQDKFLAVPPTSRSENYKDIKQWMDSLVQQTQDAEENIVTFAPWISPEYSHLKRFSKSFDQNLTLSSLLSSYGDIIQTAQKDLPPQDLTPLIKSLQTAEVACGELIENSKNISTTIDQIFGEMNFGFLLDKERRVFSIGYNVSDGKYDSGFYDLLASESRLASFVAIAKDDVPQEHWFRLGRQLVPVHGERSLISWTASMFEYLMPLLVMRDYENTLLNETMRTVIARQIGYGKEHHVPWGISEAGYNARDLQLNYQYGPFGVPGLGLKRGLSHDLVVSPYSTLLASMVDPVSALENIKKLMENQLLTTYGFYESVDYTPDRLPEKEKFSVIKSFMAHHQGMSLVALDNTLNNNIMQDRFHSEPQIKATQLLLQERVPQRVVPVLPKAAEIELDNESKLKPSSFIRHYANPNLSSPRAQILSNGKYSVMISTAGSGYSKLEDKAMTRWKEDATCDNWGNFIFVRDLTQGRLWSTSYQPITKLPQSYKVTFGEEKVEFFRTDEDISTHTEVIVAPEDNVEIRHVTLTNHSSEDRILELTSYLEPVLAPLNRDLSHIAFSKLFIQTEFMPTKNALLAKRRTRSNRDQEIWGLHVVVTDGEIVAKLQYETDRVKFIGRGHSLLDPIAFLNSENLSNSTGATLDPIFSLRIRLRLPAGGTARTAFTTGLTSNRDQALELIDRYHDIRSFDRESKLAWTKSQVDLRHLDIDSESAYLFQRLAERILYSDTSLRPPSHQLALGTRVQSSLWPYGISGDLPVVVVRIAHQKDMNVVKKLLRGHEYLRLKGLIYDFVILNEHRSSYFQELQDELLRQIRATGSHGWLNRSGGIYILRADSMPERDRALIQSIARVAIAADLGPLKDQLDRKVIEKKYPPQLTVLPAWEQFITAPFKKQSAKSKKTSLPALKFFNGLGGFNQNGREYVIILPPGQWTPAPWINVIGNSKEFGFQISETGSGFTWSMNSRENRLTPWSNDPISDPPGEVIYIRDDETGQVWTPTPLPIRGDTPYTVRHGIGYSIFENTSHDLEHTLTCFVPKDESIKISRLKLKNLATRSRKISITSYTEWVLGSQREKSAPYLMSDADPISDVIIAKNPYNNEFAENVAFSDMSEVTRTFTCDRKEFLGRNGNLSSPAALKRNGLSGKTSVGEDPCAALQTIIELEPGEEREISISLGQCENTEAARRLALRYRDQNNVQKAFDEMAAYWSQIIDTVQVKTPEPQMDLMMNAWLVYQTLSSRLWARTAFYQSGGAYGFRDQLQDSMALVYSAPHLTREHILTAASRQFKEGDVQHWWHPPTGRGIRTRMSDDLLWLPFVVSFYINTTGDKTILNEIVPFLEAPILKPEEEDSYTLPARSEEEGSVLDHCTRAIDRALSLGQHGLPLMGTGDWNDGMNRVGHLGKGESIWLGWFLYKVIEDFLPFYQGPEEKYKSHMDKLQSALEENGWDGEWYKRAYFDDGTPLGSSTNEECKIDSIAQSWAVLSNAAAAQRQVQAMESVAKLLIQKDKQLVLLFTPPFDKSPLDPGYVKGYVPGVRENGGQYTHAAIWAMMAYAKLGDGEKATELFNILNPINHSRTDLELQKYKIEPYVIAADIYSGNSHEGRGGWSWYTGSASWFYRAGLESILGFQLRGNKLKVQPCIPKTWKSYEIVYKYKTSIYNVKIENPDGLNKGDVVIKVDGLLQPLPEISLLDDGKVHTAIVTLNAFVASQTASAFSPIRL